MIDALVQSAFQTGHLSVESEGLIRQVLATSSCKSADMEALRQLCAAVESGRIRREGHQQVQMPSIAGISHLRQPERESVSAY